MGKRKTAPQIICDPIWIDKAFAVSDIWTGRLKGDQTHPDEAYLDLMVGPTEDYEGGQMRINGMRALQVLYSELGDFLARLGGGPH